MHLLEFVSVNNFIKLDKKIEKFNLSIQTCYLSVDIFFRSNPSNLCVLNCTLIKSKLHTKNVNTDLTIYQWITRYFLKYYIYKVNRIFWNGAQYQRRNLFQ